MNSLQPPSLHPPTSAAEPAPFVLLGDVQRAIYRDVCYCVRPCERHKEPEQATMFPVVAPGSAGGKSLRTCGFSMMKPEEETDSLGGMSRVNIDVFTLIVSSLCHLNTKHRLMVTIADVRCLYEVNLQPLFFV